MNDDIYKVMLAHMRYSFAEIEWNFNLLTSKEKALIGSQKNLDRIREIATSHQKRMMDD